MPVDRRAESNWGRAENAYKHYVRYVDSKADRVALTFTDLVYVKNFKGGSAIIAEPQDTLVSKLARYERLLREIDAAPEFKQSLGHLKEDEYARAERRMVEFAGLGNSGSESISGFGVSFSSALLHFYFPELVPILDRRVLCGAGIAVQLDKQGQVKNLLGWYPSLIKYFRDRLKSDPQLTLRALDRSLFVEQMPRLESSQ